MGDMSSSKTADSTAFWNVNVDQQEQTVDCPDFLEYCFDNEKDRNIISTPDSHYHRLTWSEVQDLVAQDRLDLFQRVPSELRRYRQFCKTLEGRYGSVLDFILKERLKWGSNAVCSDTVCSDFDADNYKILYNDWPYGIDKNIVHLVVWTKFEMPEDPKTGRLLPEMQAKVEHFFKETFTKSGGRDGAIWFRNWISLKSIHTVEHFHVMLYNPDMNFVSKLTADDQPLAEKHGYITR